MRKVWIAGAVLLLGLVPVACDQGPLGPEPLPQFAIDPDPSVPGGNLHPEAVFVCKDVQGGAPGASFDFTATSTRNDLNTFVPAFSLVDGQCLMVGQAGGALYSVTATEAAAPGFVLDSIVRYNATFASGAQSLVISNLDKQVLTGVNSATGEASGGASGALRGALIVFYNSAEPPPPPPPPPGGEGCTPGYWKQPHHFGNWTAPYSPTTQFGDVFADAFPGKTLLDVVGQGGGGLIALGRHTVAALLNAASADVDYGMTTAEVIAAFNAAFASGDYEAQKDAFEELNEQGCPLGRAPLAESVVARGNGRGK